jgi:peroxiredoxin/predicted 2-oxoglutarate/Fe(II)-dependent dioxygenase YbiX
MFLNTGEAAPWFEAVSTNNLGYKFHTLAGRYIALCFFATAENTISQSILGNFFKQRSVFDDDKCCFFGVSIDPQDRNLARVQDHLPGIRFLWDVNLHISRLYQVIDEYGEYYPCTYILDERLRVLAVFPFSSQPESYVSQLVDLLKSLPPIETGKATIQAPVLIVPRVFEPKLCQKLIDYYDYHGGAESGFMREIDGKTVGVHDHTFKRRCDQEILDETLRNQAMYRIHDRLLPEIYKAFQFKATRMERHIVACYDGNSGGFFKPHRDNTTKGTAHRRFAVSVNLNTGAYEGGCLRFPEFGQKTYTAPVGGAIVFSCSLLHEATPVTKGYRYVYLPFLYDEESAKIRQQNFDLIKK